MKKIILLTIFVISFFVTIQASVISKEVPSYGLCNIGDTCPRGFECRSPEPICERCDLDYNWGIWQCYTISPCITFPPQCLPMICSGYGRSNCPPGFFCSFGTCINSPYSDVLCNVWHLSCSNLDAAPCGFTKCSSCNDNNPCTTDSCENQRAGWHCAPGAAWCTGQLIHGAPVVGVCTYQAKPDGKYDGTICCGGKVSECLTNSDCPLGKVCQSCGCVTPPAVSPPCKKDSDCPSDKVCSAGKCVSKTDKPELSNFKFGGDVNYFNAFWNASYPSGRQNQITVECVFNCDPKNEDCSKAQKCKPFPYLQLPGSGSCTVENPKYLIGKDNFVVCKAYDTNRPELFNWY